MADTKISALTSATTPVAGTEVLPIVQGGVTKKISIADLTAGRQVNVGSLLATGGYSTVTITSTTGGTKTINIGSDPYTNAFIGTTTAHNLSLVANGGIVAVVGTDNNIAISNASKGINFTANTGAAGKTSQLLNWYEEGTWTPTYSGWTTSPTTANAKYTRVGRLVTLHYIGNNGISVAGTSTIGGLPFTSNSQQGASVAMKDMSGAAPGVTCFATIASNATSISSMTSATFTGLYWAFSTTYMV